MLRATRTVTINAAFLREIKEDNERLQALLEEVLGMCQTRPPALVRPRRFASLLAELLDQLAMHFALEGAYGYFNDPVSVAPHLSEQADRLRRQHADLYVEMMQIAERAERIVTSN